MADLKNDAPKNGEATTEVKSFFHKNAENGTKSESTTEVKADIKDGAKADGEVQPTSSPDGKVAPAGGMSFGHGKHRAAAKAFFKGEKTLGGKKVKGSAIVIAGVLAVVLIVVAAMAITFAVKRPGSFAGFFEGEHTDGNVANFAAYGEKTAANVSDGTAPKREYKVGDPLIVGLTLKVPEGTSSFKYAFVQHDGKNAIRTGNFNVEGIAGQSETEVTRYISFVSSSRNTIPAGKYDITVTDKDDKEIAKRVVTITE